MKERFHPNFNVIVKMISAGNICHFDLNFTMVLFANTILGFPKHFSDTFILISFTVLVY